jgi:hypothetical protein
MVAVAHILRARSPHRALPLRPRAGWRALASAIPSHPLGSSVARKDAKRSCLCALAAWRNLYLAARAAAEALRGLAAPSSIKPRA